MTINWLGVFSSITWGDGMHREGWSQSMDPGVTLPGPQSCFYQLWTLGQSPNTSVPQSLNFTIRMIITVTYFMFPVKIK